MASLNQMITQLRAVESRYNSACRQLLILTSKMEQEGLRYERATKKNQLSQRYNLRIRLVVMDGIKTNFIEYCTRLAFLIERMESEIRMSTLSQRMERVNFTEAA